MKFPVFEPAVSSLLECLPKREFTVTHILRKDNTLDKVVSEPITLNEGMHGDIEFIMHIGDSMYNSVDNDETQSQYYVLYWSDGQFRFVKGYFEDEGVSQSEE